MIKMVNKLKKKWKEHGGNIFAMTADACMAVKREFLTFYIHKMPNYLIKHSVLWYNRFHSNRFSREVSYIREKGLTVFPYPFREKYLGLEFEAQMDSGNGMYFIVVNGKKLYFPASHDPEMISQVVRQLLLEQDQESPHRYFSDAFPAKGDYLLDVGAQEGLEALLHVEDFSHLILFECEPEWIRALNATFAPYGDKVTVLPKRVGNANDEMNITLDRVLETCGLHGDIVVKMDIEGAERFALEGADKLLENQGARWVVCTYHTPDDDEVLRERLEKAGYQTRYSPGYMIWPLEMRMLQGKHRKYFRHGLVYGVR